MEWNLTTILILLGVLFAGYGIGLLEMHLRRAKKIRQLQSALQILQEAPPPAGVAPASSPVSLRLAAGEAGDQTLELDGVRLVSPVSVTPVQRRRLITLLNGVRPWVEGEAAPASKPAPGSPGVPSKIPAVVSVPDMPNPGTLSMVAQIDAILQTRLAATPFASRRIRLSETLSGGVLVSVDANRYEGLDLVPDPQVVAEIRAAITEWEKRIK